MRNTGSLAGFGRRNFLARKPSRTSTNLIQMRNTLRSVTPGEVERMYAALAREMQSVPATVALQHDREAQDDSFHGNVLELMF